MLKAKDIESKIPSAIVKTMQEIEFYGFDCYLVGGSLRDILLGKEPVDYDLATSATPLDIKYIFAKVISTGEKYGTVTVVFEGYSTEVTTLRSDGRYKNNRKPDDVIFVKSVEDDLARRDFTINAMAYSLKQNKIIDPFNGKSDLRRKIIRAVNNPEERFQEDALRILRAVRFASTHEFVIEKKTHNAVYRLGYLLENISKERIRDEFCKILMCNDPTFGVNLLKVSGLLKYIVPELEYCIDFDQQSPYHSKDVFNHTLTVLANTEKDLSLRLGAFFHDIGKPLTFSRDDEGIGHFYDHHVVSENIVKYRLKELKFDNDTIDLVSMLVREHMSRYPKVRKKSIKKLLNRVGEDSISLLLKLQRADILGSKPPHDFTLIDELECEINRILIEEEPFSLKDLAVNGNDLKSIGFEEGPAIGRALNLLLDLVLGDESRNTKDVLLAYANMNNFCNNMEKDG